MFIVGIDVGGTFTDLVAIGADGSVETRKVLSTPADQSQGVEEALRAFGERDVDRVVHGTVTDFIDFHFWPVFNVADSAISTGVVLLIAGYLLRRPAA